MAELRSRGKMNNAFDPDAAPGLDPATRRLIDRRTRALGPAYRLFYSEPVHVVRGEGCRLWDSEGTEYLDAYNNVVSVGHGHPRVVEAVHRQMQTLCTHTRYLSEPIVEYAEELLSTLSGPVSAGHLMLTCTGSEANDLAMRIAKRYTGQLGVVVTAEAYHGNSEQVASISPSLGQNSPLGAWVRQVPAPDSLRVSAELLPERLAQHVAEQVRDLERHGVGLAALIVDSIFASDGIYAAPPGLLGPAADVVRRAGGLLIADEVQCGFARTGEAMWGYQRHRVDPDIVTLGKPMGNGYPVAGVVATAEVLAQFGHEVRYFNTFGGNTVAVAAARATFDVIREEDLMGNAHRVGKLLQDGLRDLAARHEQIADVRGAGLYVGAEIVEEPEGLRPDGATAAAIVNGLRQRRVLISATGRDGNVLKIRPPLVFTPQDADRLLSLLGETLKDLATR